ncbi:MAG: anaerobic ribonucleoside-triphosphate reductase activating protein [Anaerolineaceae bacterium]|nr:anaerobic ribonucleoside-triphosphate reductase activating protein [Anaerolineaceae bacterium]
MKFGGFQKLSLLNFPEKTACVLFTAGCNFRCPYCHNAELWQREAAGILEEEVLGYLRKRRGMLDGICISGGEPLNSDETLPFLEQIKELGYAVKIDTNGSFPERLERIISAGLVDYAAMDVKNTMERYAETAGLSAVSAENIRRSVSLLKSGRIPYEFRTTVVREYHTAEEIGAIGRMLSGASVWYLQPFRDAPQVPAHDLHAPDSRTLEEFGSIGNRYVKTIIRN